MTALGCQIGYIGPCNLPFPVYVDRSAAAIRNFVGGANEDGYHIRNINWHRDSKIEAIVDLREIKVGDPSPDGKGKIRLKRGIEVGHIFQLGDKYSKSMKANVLNDSGKTTALQMGCYGMGVTRLAGAVIEQNHDESGIIWPHVLAPFEAVIIPINAQKSQKVFDKTEELYAELKDLGCDVILDDRDDVRPGVKFNEWELIGVPHRLVIGEKSLKKNKIEYTHRKKGEALEISKEKAISLIN